MIKLLTFLIVTSCLLMMTSSVTRAASLETDREREDSSGELLKTLFRRMRPLEDLITEDPKQTRSVNCPYNCPCGSCNFANCPCT
ncbi:hypothetical protein V1264_004337 [Littorina saxatilis]|uniref:Conotoxin n=1 Tax=Littorina saxatilis TaxID=31220 RepID=A0AAN9B4G8_9CAEN